MTFCTASTALDVGSRSVHRGTCPPCGPRKVGDPPGVLRNGSWPQGQSSAVGRGAVLGAETTFCHPASPSQVTPAPGIPRAALVGV